MSEQDEALQLTQLICDHAEQHNNGVPVEYCGAGYILTKEEAEAQRGKENE